MCYRLLEGLVSQAKIMLHLFQQHFTPHTPPLKQGESERTLGPDLPSTRIIRSTIPFHKCCKSCRPLSDLMTRYGPQVTTIFTSLVLVPFKHEPSNQNVGKQRKKNYGTITEISASLTFLTLPMEQR